MLWTVIGVLVLAIIVWWLFGKGVDTLETGAKGLTKVLNDYAEDVKNHGPPPWDRR